MGVNLPPRRPLAALPTPLVRADRLGRVLGLDLWVKRDDLSGFVHAGNKARPLELLVEDAVRTGHDHLVGCGGPSSNFCAGLAAAASTAGLRCTLVLYGDQPDPAPFNLAAARAWGAEVTFTGDPDRAAVEAAARRTAAALAADGHRPYVVPRGGATPLGTAGFAAASVELAGQIGEGPRPERIVMAAGSGASAAGLLTGLGALGWSTTIAAAAVSRPAEETATRIGDLATACAELIGVAPPDAGLLDVHDCIGPGFGRAAAGDEMAADLARRTEGLLLDATYTAKAAALLVRLAREAPMPTIFWHTGGVVAAVTELTRGTSGGHVAP
jgi:D-cysteine desulfhydrase